MERFEDIYNEIKRLTVHSTEHPNTHKELKIGLRILSQKAEALNFAIAEERACNSASYGRDVATWTGESAPKNALEDGFVEVRRSRNRPKQQNQKKQQ